MDKCMKEYFLLGNEFRKSEEFENYNISIEKSLYEVIRISDGIPIFLRSHLKRLENSAEIMSYTLDVTRSEIISVILELIKKNKAIDGNIKLVVNYKVNKVIEGKNNEAKEVNEGNKNDKDIENNQDLKGKLLIYFIHHSYPTEQQYLEGVKTITYNGERSNPNAKVINSDFREKVNEEIHNKGVYEAILIDHAGFITEGSKSNIFMVIGSTVVTSKVENVLPGITRQFIIKTCNSLNIEFEERSIHEDDIKSLGGLFISGTSPKVLPIKAVDAFSFDSSGNSIINSIMVGFEAEINNNKQKFVKYIENNTINK